MKKNNYYKNILTSCIAIGIFFVCIPISFAQQKLSVQDISSYTALLTSQVIQPFEKKYPNQEDLYLPVTLKKLCETLQDDNLWFVQFTDSDGNIVRYRAKESVFVSIFCNTFQATKADKSIHQDPQVLPLNNVLKRYNLRSLWIICMPSSTTNLSLTSDNCEQWVANNTIDIPYIAFSLASQVMNEIFNFMIARIYWVSNSSESPKDLSNAYFVNHFNTLGSLPEQKNYPQTYQQVMNYITKWKNIHKSSKLFKLENAESLQDLSQRKHFLYYDAQQTSFSRPQDVLANYQWIATDIVYNELFFYTVIMQVYKAKLHEYWQSTKEMPLAIQHLTPSQAIQLQVEKISSLNQKLKMAIEQSLRQINNLNAQLPIHIWLLMYQEDLLNLRGNIAKIYLPLHQLHYKLENIQSKE